jgi:fructokinase
MKYDVVALGELLIDFTIDGKSNQGNNTYEANPGGAPCNVLAMLNKMNKKTAFIGKVGNDAFGQILKKTIDDVGIDSKGLMFDEHVNTTLAFVNIDENGERSFSFYRNPGADMMLREEEIQQEIFADTKIFHFGTLSMTDLRMEQVTKHAVKKAKEQGAVISFDPNLRPQLWKKLGDAADKMWYGISQCDILKISDDEISFLTGTADIDQGIGKIMEQYCPALICATMGKDGSKAYYKGKSVYAEPFLQKNTIETTGAGDTFMACILNTVLDKGINGLSENDMYEMLRFANAAASIITTRKGALKVMPQNQEIRDMLQEG